jgi:hypothetical protein
VRKQAIDAAGDEMEFMIAIRREWQKRVAK